MRKTKFQIKGMHCNSCAALIEGRLKSHAGVMAAKVNFDSKKAVVVHDEKKVQTSQFQKIVQEAGDYQIELIEKEAADEMNQDNDDNEASKLNKKSGAVFQNTAKSAFLTGLFSGLFVISVLLNIYFLFFSGKASEPDIKAAEQVANPTVAGDEINQARPEAAVVASFNITKDDHVRGDFNSPITLVEFSDFECPFCERHYPTLNKILNDYKNKVRLVYKHFPLGFHPNAQKAAEASECADEQSKFWAYHDKLFENQPQGYSLDKFKQWAKDLGLNSSKFNDCLDSGKFAEKVRTDYQEGVQKGVNGTPATFVNGKLVSGALPYGSFKQIIDQLIK